MSGILDRDSLEISLAHAERQVANVEQDVARQRMVVAGMELCGHDATRATHLLWQFEEVLATHIADRDRLRSELEL